MKTVMKLVTAATTGLCGSYCTSVDHGTKYQALGNLLCVQKPKYTQPHMHMEKSRENLRGACCVIVRASPLQNGQEPGMTLALATRHNSDVVFESRVQMTKYTLIRTELHKLTHTHMKMMILSVTRSITLRLEGATVAFLKILDSWPEGGFTRVRLGLHVDHHHHHNRLPAH